MIDAQGARMMARWNAWANRLWFETLAALPEGEAVKERRSLFKNMVHTMNHNYVIERIWQAHIEGRAHGYAARNTPDHPPLAELTRLHAEADQWYVDWAQQQTDVSLREAVRFQLIGSSQGEMTRAEVLLHVVQHCAYHRGFVGDMLFQAGSRPPITDLPVYVREVGRR